MLNYLKAIAGGLVGLGATWLSAKWGFALTPEVQASIVAAIVAAVVALVPNIDKTA